MTDGWHNDARTLKVRRLHPEAKLPTRATDGSAGYDLYWTGEVDYKTMSWFHTGVAVEIPPGHVGLVRGRSSLADKATTFDGTIDSDYRGEISVHLRMRPFGVYPISTGDRIAQLVIVPCLQVPVDEVDALTPTERGSGGFGSTGQ